MNKLASFISAILIVLNFIVVGLSSSLIEMPINSINNVLLLVMISFSTYLTVSTVEKLDLF